MHWLAGNDMAILCTKLVRVEVLIFHLLQVHSLNLQHGGGLDGHNYARLAAKSVCHGIVLLGEVLYHAAQLLKNRAPMWLAISSAWRYVWLGATWMPMDQSWRSLVYRENASNAWGRGDNKQLLVVDWVVLRGHYPTYSYRRPMDGHLVEELHQLWYCLYLWLLRRTRSKK